MRSNPFHATIGLRVEPRRRPGVEFRLDVDHTRMPLYVYKKRELRGRDGRSTSAPRCMRACTVGRSPTAS